MYKNHRLVHVGLVERRHDRRVHFFDLGLAFFGFFELQRQNLVLLLQNSLFLAPFGLLLLHLAVKGDNPTLM